MAAISTKKVPGGLPEIKLPPGAARNFGRAMADILEVQARNPSAEVQRIPAEELRWSLAYEQGPDPDGVDDCAEFAAALAKASTVYLLARSGGAVKWKGAATLDATPPQIMAKFEERARLVCGSKAREIDDHEPVEHKHPLLAAFDEWVDGNQLQDDALAAYVRSGIATLVKR